STNAPAKVPLPFPSSGTKNAIPTASQIGITPGAASLTDGFPPLTFTPLSAGGVPPAGADFNGIFNLITAIQQWQSAGGFFQFDSSFATSIGGYPLGALLAKASGTGFWLCTANNNSANPDTGGAGWVEFDPAAVQSGAFNYALDTGSANTYVVALKPAPTALTDGMMIWFKALTANTGASTLNLNGLGAIPITGAGAAIGAGVIVANGYYGVMYSSAANAWLLVAQSAGVIAGALTLSAADARYVQRSTGLQFAVGSSGTLTANQYLSGYQAISAVTFPANFSGSSMSALVAATGSQTIKFVKILSGNTSGSVVGTATFAARGTVATLETSGSAVSLAAGDKLLAQVPSTADATLATIVGTLVGSI
ncbi:MAG: hypothetical protein B7X10_04190, partial [Burkholderiales bacterium 21-58-4]